MLRITPGVAGHSTWVVKLEGKLLAPWVEELREACREPSLPPGQTLELDLTAVSYADAAGIELLEELLGQGIKIGGCSRFLAELLHLETPGT